MWLWIFISFNLVLKLRGFSNGDFPQSCSSMLPDHGDSNAQSFPSPYLVTCQNCNSPGDPVTVTLKSKDSRPFIGFMLEARNASLGGDGPALGTFIALENVDAKLLNCDDSPDSAVSQKHNREKTSISVNWTAGEVDCDIIFRATVLEKFTVFWDRVDYVYCRPTITPEPPPCSFPMMEIFGLVVMCVENLVEGVAWTVDQCISKSELHLKKGLIFCNAVCAGLAILSWVFFFMAESDGVTLIVLVGVLIGIILIELGLLLLPLGPSHELKEIWGLAHKVCCIIHRVFTIAIILVGVTNCIIVREENKALYWLFIVVIMYTVWIRLNEICVSEFNVRKRKQQKKNENEDDKHEPRGIKKSFSPVKMVMFATIFMIGNLVFTAAVIPGLLECQ